ncbi:hypothetical protein ABMB68_009072 [Bradyrhizobium sp. RT4a]
MIHRRGPWRNFEAVEFATLEWVDWFNNRRLLEPVGNIPPAEAEQRYYAMLKHPAMAAELKPSGLRQANPGRFTERFSAALKPNRHPLSLSSSLFAGPAITRSV